MSGVWESVNGAVSYRSCLPGGYGHTGAPSWHDSNG